MTNVSASPAPSWGGGWGVGGVQTIRRLRVGAPPLPTLPHKGGGLAVLAGG
jgi:hypothetical protein